MGIYVIRRRWLGEKTVLTTASIGSVEQDQLLPLEAGEERELFVAPHTPAGWVERPDLEA